MLPGVPLDGVLGPSPSCHFAFPEYRARGSYLQGEKVTIFLLAAFRFFQAASFFQSGLCSRLGSA